MKKIFTLFWLSSCLLYAVPQGISSAIENAGLSKDDIGIYIKEISPSGRIVASINKDTPKTPASVIKVLSTYSSVLKLGFNHKWPTKFYIAGTLDKNGVLNGDLVVKGFGDPTFSTRNLKTIVVRIISKGIKHISGDIVIDRSYFNVGEKNNSGFDEYTYSPYNAMPDAMMINERVSTICIVPNKNRVNKKTPDESYKVINKLTRVDAPCKGKYTFVGARVDKNSASPTVFLQGKVSKKCGKINVCKVITKPYKTFHYALKAMLKKYGVEVGGTMRLEEVPSGAKEIFTHYSKTLEKIVSKTAKKSNNLYARHLLLYMGAKEYGAPSTLEKGRKAVEKILRRYGAIKSKDLTLDNGCGLSHDAKISAKLLSDVLEHAYKKFGQKWMNTLSIAGVDGTIKKRFRGTVVKNRAWMKTGTLNRVKNISGYVKGRNGKLYTVVILVNSNKGNWRASQLQNDIIKWLVLGEKVKKKKSTTTKGNTK